MFPYLQYRVAVGSNKCEVVKDAIEGIDVLDDRNMLCTVRSSKRICVCPIHVLVLGSSGNPTLGV